MSALTDAGVPDGSLGLCVDTREDAVEKTKEFPQAAGEGVSELLQVLEMPPPAA